MYVYIHLEFRWVSALLFSLNGKFQASESLRTQRIFGEIISLCITCTTLLSFVFATYW